MSDQRSVQRRFRENAVAGILRWQALGRLVWFYTFTAPGQTERNLAPVNQEFMRRVGKDYAKCEYIGVQAIGEQHGLRHVHGFFSGPRVVVPANYMRLLLSRILSGETRTDFQVVGGDQSSVEGAVRYAAQNVSRYASRQVRVGRTFMTRGWLDPREVERARLDAAVERAAANAVSASRR
jgi:hypothetical protein